MFRNGEFKAFQVAWRHNSTISQLNKEVETDQKSLNVVLLYLAKAYPSLPYQLIKKALDHYHVPTEIVSLVMLHLDRLKMTFTVVNFTTRWLRLEKGIMAGCTVSVIFFSTAMNLLLEAGGKVLECRGPVAVDGTRHPSCRAVMDDITVWTSSITGTRWVYKH